MIDTIKFEIPASSEVIEAVRSFLHTYARVDNVSGEVLSSFCRGSLRGSWDSRISCKIRDQRFCSVLIEQEPCRIREKRQWGPDKITAFKRTVKRTISIGVPEYLEVEFSLAKWAMSVNFVNSTLLQDAERISVFRNWFSGLIGVDFPPLSEWHVVRVDIGINYFIGSDDLVQRMLDCYRNLTYSRRRPIIYETSVYFPGTTTTDKLYNKGAEFKVHDRSRFVSAGDSTLYEQLQFLANGILRYEVEFHKRKLEQLGLNTVEQVFAYSGWGELMKKQINKVLSGATTTKIFTMKEVRTKLQDNKDSFKGSHVSAEVVYAIWLSISLNGKSETSKVYGRMKVSRALNVLNQLDISCVANITEHEPPPVPEFDFMAYDSLEYDTLMNNKIVDLLNFDYTPIDRFYDSKPFPRRLGTIHG